MLRQMAEMIAVVERPHPVRVAIDGVDAAGKTILADELAELIICRARPVLRASIDGFHRPRADRYRRGPDSPEGYYLDSFDHASLRLLLLEPLGPAGDRRVCTAVYDFRADEPLAGRRVELPQDAILVFDGVFLFRPELNDQWDFRVFVSVGFDETLRRACRRDLALFGSVEATRARCVVRYTPGQRLYMRAVRPQGLADVVVRNRDPAHPRLLVRRSR